MAPRLVAKFKSRLAAGTLRLPSSGNGQDSLHRKSGQTLRASTVKWERQRRPLGFFAEEGIDRYGLLVGRVQPNIDIRRFTGQMLSDIESLLIHRIKPPGNIQCLRGRTRR